MPDQSNRPAQSPFGEVKKMFQNLLLGLWFAGWGLVLLVGLGLSSWALTAGVAGVLTTTSGIAIGGMAAGLLGRGWWRKNALKKRAQTSLVAKAELDRLAINRREQVWLESFDVAYRRVMEELKDPALRGISADLNTEVNLRKVREHLYRLVKTLVALRKDLVELERLRSGAASGAIDEIRRQIGHLEQEADSVTTDVQKLWSQLANVRRLAAQAPSGAEGEGPFRESLDELDRLLQSYKDLDDEALDTAQARAERMLRDARQAH